MILPFAAFGQQIVQDSIRTEVRQPPKDKIDAYAKEDAFNYDHTPPESQSLAEKIRYWLQKQIDLILENSAAEDIMDIVLFIGFAAFLVLLINQYMKGNMNSVFRGEKISKPDSFVLEKKGDNRDLDKLVQKAIEKNQYNLAIRYLYQQSLLQLQNEGYINWKKNKTNRDYLYEINQGNLQEIFREVTRYYELSEYGDFSINNSDFQQIYSRFKEFKSLIQPS